MENELSCRGFIVHAYAETARNRICILGRLEDGHSFAAVETQWRPSLLIYKDDLDRFRRLFSPGEYKIFPAKSESFEGKNELLELKFNSFTGRNTAAKILEQSGIPYPERNQKIPDSFLIEKGIRGPLQISGNVRPGRLVDLVFRDPVLAAANEFSPLMVPLKLCSIDIETDVKTGTILAIASSVSSWNRIDSKKSLVRVLLPQAIPQVSPGKDLNGLFFHPDEKSLLKAFLADMSAMDADVLTGWNFLDFDYPRLAERCLFHHIPFLLSRSREEAKFFPGTESEEKNPGDVQWTDRRHSAAALVPGRQVIDALRIVRSGPRKLPGYTLEAAAQAVLGTGKTVSSSGEQKIEELEKLYREDPEKFGRYCRRDAELVLEILEKTGLFRLTLERASLTGVSLDKAWTSVKTFERIYGLQLYSRNIAPPMEIPGRRVSGAAGGTVLEPLPGFFSNVGVFDFRSLYPTIMRTFNIDPLAHARAGVNAENLIQAPNGANFTREPGILPAIIGSYFEARRKALAGGDEEASHVYKILMNSFYGVLGTGSCHYGRTELAGAITSFAKKWLHFSRDWFDKKGYRVLYGDTDSLFVESGLEDQVSFSSFQEWGNSLSRELNLSITEAIRNEYNLESCIELRFEKPYRRFMIPPLRNYPRGSQDSGNGSRGRAKGYGGWVLDSGGALTTEVKGMEAVRSDSTPLARRIQMELLEQVFGGSGQNELKSYIADILNKLRHGSLDGELIYRKRLSRPPKDYVSSTPPQVKAARALGWQDRRGTVEYIWTLSGPEPTALPHGQPDYDHYTESQILPVARSIAAAAGWDTEIFPHNKKDYLSDGQMELEFSSKTV